MKNPLKEIVRDGGVAIGCVVHIGHPEITEMLSNVGYDFLFIDAEHGPFGIETLQMMLQAMSGTKTVPIVRVPWNEPGLVKLALDIGAYGVVVPLISTKQDAENLVRAMKYPPAGIRGVMPRRASRYSLDIKEYYATADKELLVMVQIETREAVDNISEILSVDGVDAYSLGPTDLSASYGHIGEMTHPKVEEAISKVLEAGKKAHKIGCGYGKTLDVVQKRIEQGFQLITVGTDWGHLMGAAQESLKKVRGLVNDFAGKIH
jgi:2-dehydro-3-deoxyglucarate aldolase